MKRKSIYLFAALATAAFSLSSCSNDDSAESVNSPAELKITAEMYPAIEVNTRAAYDIQSTTPADFTNIGIYVWYTRNTAAKASAPTYAGYANDKVASYSGTGPYTLTPTTNPTMYFPVDNADVDVYLYAPYKATPTQTNMNMQHTVAADQSLEAGYLASDFIYGKATADYDALSNPKEARVTMYHAMSKILFKVVSNGVSPTNMTNISLKNVYTTTTIRMPQTIAGSAPYLSCGSAATDNVDVASVLGDVKVWGTSGTVTISDAQTYGVAAVIPPQTTSSASGSEAKVSITVDGKTATANFSNITLAPGYVYTYNLKLTGQTLTITLVSIQDWISGGSGNLDFTNWS